MFVPQGGVKTWQQSIVSKVADVGDVRWQEVNLF
jgi:hypothetical protein